MADEAASLDYDDILTWLKNEAILKYKEAIKLSTEDSKDDPDTEPYKSKYAAREILLNLKNKLASSLDIDRLSLENAEDEVDLTALRCVVGYDLALNYIETEEKSTGERFLNEIVTKTADVQLEPQYCSLVLGNLQQLGILWNERSEFEKSLEYLKKAEELYKDYKETKNIAPYTRIDHFLASNEEGTKVNRERIFEDQHTHTMYYMTQVYKNLGENKKSAQYCHETLSRQLVTKSYEAADWAVNCATLSQYHITQDDYKTARHCLACASVVMAEANDTAEPSCEMTDELEGEEARKQREHVPQAKANVALCWSKYCLDLLTSSALKFTDATENEKSVNDVSESEMLRFTELLHVVDTENQVPCDLVTNYDQARLLFLAGQRYLNAAKDFYKLDGYVSNYVEILQDHSQLYKHLAFFDTDLDHCCKMCKRRVDMLSAVLGELNPQHYLQVCRQLIFECASIYSDMADMKIAIIDASKPAQPSSHQINKVNSLLEKSAKFYESFVDSLKHDGKLPDKYDEDLCRVALLAHLYLARIYSKKICGTSQQCVENCKKSLDLYKYIVGYCDKNEEAAVCFNEELQACREMVALLPCKLSRLCDGNWLKN